MNAENTYIVLSVCSLEAINGQKKKQQKKGENKSDPNVNCRLPVGT